MGTGRTVPGSCVLGRGGITWADAQSHNPLPPPFLCVVPAHDPRRVSWQSALTLASHSTPPLQLVVSKHIRWGFQRQFYRRAGSQDLHGRRPDQGPDCQLQSHPAEENDTIGLPGETIGPDFYGKWCPGKPRGGWKSQWNLGSCFHHPHGQSLQCMVARRSRAVVPGQGGQGLEPLRLLLGASCNSCRSREPKP